MDAVKLVFYRPGFHTYAEDVVALRQSRALRTVTTPKVATGDPFVVWTPVVHEDFGYGTEDGAMYGDVALG